MAEDVTGSFTAFAQRPAFSPPRDPLTAALEKAGSTLAVVPLSKAEALAEISALVDEADRGDYSPWLLSRAVDIATCFPDDERLQYHVGKLMSISGHDTAARLCWREIVSRFPFSYNIFPEYLKIVLKTFGHSTATQIFTDHVHHRSPQTNPTHSILIARCLAILGDIPRSLEILDQAEDVSTPDLIAKEKAKLLRSIGRFDEALETLESLENSEATAGLANDIRRAATLFKGRHTVGPPSVAALETLLEHVLAHRTHHRAVTEPIGGVILIGGSLGGGGAERQLANTALGLNEQAEHGSRIYGPVSIFCRKLDRRRSNDFYLHKLEDANIRVADYLSAQPWGGDANVSVLAPYRELIDLLPHRMREGVINLSDQLRQEAPDVVQIWQDGMIFAAGLAALIAGTPRIILNVRTMPPNRRTDRQKPEQETLYRGLLAAPGVSLTANSSIAARAYEEWLDLPKNTVLTIANGVVPLPTTAPDDEQARWENFDVNTNRGFVVGGVMRLDDNKRPLLWLEICAALARLKPAARFILAGNGPLRAATEDHAQRLGIAERTLFVGRTTHVGFWLGKMDALVLTSRHEGVPNALIEAQLAGLPVVTTPAGGAPEAVAPHPANYILADASMPDAGEAGRHLSMLAARDQSEREAAEDAVRQWAKDRYAREKMIERTLDILTL